MMPLGRSGRPLELVEAVKVIRSLTPGVSRGPSSQAETTLVVAVPRGGTLASARIGGRRPPPPSRWAERSWMRRARL